MTEAAVREFPAQFARASLKLDFASGGGGVVVEISRAICAGLIEATRLPSNANIIMQFPAQFARASLKHGDGQRYICDDAKFPAQFARASLKPSGVVFQAGRGVEISRAICAGLIEAC